MPRRPGTAPFLLGWSSPGLGWVSARSRVLSVDARCPHAPSQPRSPGAGSCPAPGRHREDLLPLSYSDYCSLGWMQQAVFPKCLCVALKWTPLWRGTSPWIRTHFIRRDTESHGHWDSLEVTKDGAGSLCATLDQRRGKSGVGTGQRLPSPQRALPSGGQGSVFVPGRDECQEWEE